MGSFVYRAFKALREEKAASENAATIPTAEPEEEAVGR
jgi:hypothetical protein